MVPTWLQIIAAILALSGWAKVLFDHISAIPKIRGRVFAVLQGMMINAKDSSPKHSTYMTHLYLYNMRKNSIDILDYEMEIFIDNIWIKLDRCYTFYKNERMNFEVGNGEAIKFDNLKDRLIYKKGLPVEYGVPLSGWILFLGPVNTYKKPIKKYRITCIDAYNKKHVFITQIKDLPNLHLVLEMEELDVPEGAITR